MLFSCFLNLWVTQPCKEEKEKGADNIGNFCNNNKHNISPITIPLPIVSLALSTASEPLNSYYSANPHRLYCQHCNVVSASSPVATKSDLPKSDTIAAAVLWLLLIKNPVFFSLKKKPLQQGTLGKPFNALGGTITLQRVRPVSSKCGQLFPPIFLI